MEVITRLQDPNWWREEILKPQGGLYFLCRNVLQTLEDPTPGYKDLYPPTHKATTDFIEQYARPGQKLLILEPRGWIKSYIAVVGWTIQRICRNLVEGRREHMIISNATLPNAKEMLEKIKYNFAYNELLRAAFKSWLPTNLAEKSASWTQDEINICGNKVETGSAEGNLVSRHYLIGLNDDLVNRDNTNTADQIAKVIDWWRLFQSLLLPTGIELITGTRWDEDDLYGYILKTFIQVPKELQGNPFLEWHRDKYHLLQVKAYLDPENRKGSTFPNLFPDWKLHEIEREQSERFGGQYLNDPIAMSSKPFKPAWLNKTFDPARLPEVRATIMTIDPTDKEKEQSDFTGMVVAEAGVDKNVYIPFAQRQQITDMKLVHWMVDVAVQYMPGMVGIEENKYSTIMELLEILMPAICKRLMAEKVPQHKIDYIRTLRNICFELKPRGRPKDLRIGNLTGWFESGRMFLAPTGMEDLKDELLRFPSTKRKDIADALAYVLDVLIFPTQEDPPKWLTVPAELKMTDEERERAEWERIMEGRKQDEARGWEHVKDLY